MSYLQALRIQNLRSENLRLREENVRLREHSRLVTRKLEREVEDLRARIKKLEEV